MTDLVVKNPLLQAMIFLLVSVILTGFFCYLLFQMSAFSHTPIFFYRGIKIILLATYISTVLIAIVSKYFFSFDGKDFLIVCLIPLLFWLLFFTHFPVTGERAVSIFLLGYMRDNGNRAISKEELQQKMEAIYIEEYSAIEKRIAEQIYTGTIAPENEKYKLTNKGIELLKFYDAVTNQLQISSQLLTPCRFSNYCEQYGK